MGSDLTLKVIKHLTRFFGIRHVFSLVERHQFYGVEDTNKLILRHLCSLVHDERVISKWSNPTVLPLIQYVLNTECVSSESGIVPLHAHSGNLDNIIPSLPKSTDPINLQIHMYSYSQIISIRFAS